MPRRTRRPSPSTSPERLELQASPSRAPPEPVFVPEANEVREIVLDSDGEGDDIRAVMEATEAQGSGEEAREGSADDPNNQGEEAREGGADDSSNRGDEARQGGAEGESQNPPVNAAAPPANAGFEVNLPNPASAASAPRAAGNAEERRSVNLSEFTLEQKREMLARLSQELQAGTSQNPTNLGSTSTRINPNSSEVLSAMSGAPPLIADIADMQARAARMFGVDSTGALGAGFGFTSMPLPRVPTTLSEETLELQRQLRRDTLLYPVSKNAYRGHAILTGDLTVGFQEVPQA